MIARKCEISDLKKALEVINVKYNNNIVFNRLEKNNGIRFTLKVKDSKKDGARRGHSGRRLINACYHVHGDFFDALFTVNENAYLWSRSNRINKDSGNWVDFNIGSIMIPRYMSKACDCN